ncbi:PREDICTED: F-box/kelch-repeat protein At1g74510-like [Nelumbo nucifera]|uniref:F-box/kelch-repeat protein At1g74510-like n=1 Tax=Nelumbo nucifera TaxID=4432 RepID=A0A1U8A567_NELNU|nr:PREDICTED: F-box/kelch-repeat protein At1g74510-like [Nelumbo nucifera]
MLEGQSCLVSRALPGTCEQDSKWVYMTYRLIEVSKGKRRLEDDGREEPVERKSSKRIDALEKEEMTQTLQDPSPSTMDESSNKGDHGDQSARSFPVSNGNRRLEDDGQGEHGENKSSKRLDTLEKEETTQTLQDLSPSPVDESSNEGDHGDQSDLNSLIQPIGRDMSINCLLRCSRSDYGLLASLNRSFRSLFRTGELYKLRRKMGVIEHWVYFACHLLEWEAFDPIRRRWMHLPRMPANECFMCSDKESLAVGTELLVFGKEVRSHVIYRYSILTNSWSAGMRMNAPRCLFGSASLGEIAILAGGCDSEGNILSSAELYNSETGTWVTLPSMNKPRKMCSGVFMDGKFYVIGGSNQEAPLTCGEVYDLETKMWTEIPNMFPGQNGAAGGTAPPLVAVVNNELYAADYAEQVVKKYVKSRILWDIVGRLPERAVSMNGWGLAFRACGDRLIVIGGPRALGGGTIELNSWSPKDGAPQWDLLACRPSGSFVYNCAVMGC